MRVCLALLGVTLACLSGTAYADAPPADFSDVLSGIDSFPVMASNEAPVPIISNSLEKSVTQALPNGDNVDLYAGYPGTPALGPKVDSPLVVALDNMSAPSGESWLDSAYTAFGVVTAGLAHDDWKLEVSRFAGHFDGRSPYAIARLDSTALRYTWSPDSNWTIESSWGSLKSPEGFAPYIDETRWTASARYTLPFGRSGTWSALLAWGLKQESIGVNLNALALDAECKPVNGWTIFAHGGFEQDNAFTPTGALNPAATRQARTVSLGAVHDWKVLDRVKLGAGGLYAFERAPDLPSAAPVPDARGAVAFVRLTAQ
jgi:hypothetical protein